MKTSTGRKIRYGGTSIAIVALVIAAVIAINAIATLLTDKFMWYGDMTPELKFTISEECFELIGEETNNGKSSAIEMVKKFRQENAAYNKANPTAEKKNENEKIKIIFLYEEDIAAQTDGYIYNNAKELQAKFPDYIELEFTDAMKNPKRFEKYLSSNADTIDFNSVIVEFGGSHKIDNFKNFYVYDNTQGQPYQYNAERRFAAHLLAVTRAQMPLACWTYNHGETFPTAPGYNLESATYPFLQSLEEAGFEVRAIDLEKEEIPEECKLLITYNPRRDFVDTTFDKKGELKKLDNFLSAGKSYMVFLDSTAGKLSNLESFLDEWGLSVRRQTNNNEPIIAKDSANALLGNSSAIYTDYAQNDLMSGWAENLSDPVIFENAMVLEYSKDYKQLFETLGTDANKSFSYGYNDAYPPQGRIVYPMFYTRDTAMGYASGESVVNSTATDPLMLMAVSTQTYYEEDQMGDIKKSLPYAATVVLCGTTEFGSAEYLYSDAYGNQNMLLSISQISGNEPIPTNLTPKDFANYTIESISARAATIYTVVLTLAPIAITSLAGVIVLVRRKNK